MEVTNTLEIHCFLPDKVNHAVPRSVLCDAMQRLTSELVRVREHDKDLTLAPSSGYLVVEEACEDVVEKLSEGQLRNAFILDGAKGPALYRCLEAHQMPGGFPCEEWFKVRDLETAYFPVLRKEVADSLGFERVYRYETEHYAQYNTGLGLAALLVRYLEAFAQWRVRFSAP